MLVAPGPIQPISSPFQKYVQCGATNFTDMLWCQTAAGLVTLHGVLIEDIRCSQPTSITGQVHQNRDKHRNVGLL
ncbi:hypothetical protein CKJ61_24300 [Mycobacterium intracellulare]|nr:hypothetical protein CKJ61_24300 [Mycobacterium intracellulare]